MKESAIFRIVVLGLRVFKKKKKVEDNESKLLKLQIRSEVHEQQGSCVFLDARAEG